MPVLVSVIVPVYNVSQYLERCLDSLISQTMTDIEILCIDDASTDISLEILKKYQAIDARIKIFVNEYNRGLSYTRNLGIGKARGEFILFVDSDDWIESNGIHDLFKEAHEKHLDILYFDYICHYENKSLYDRFKNLKHIRTGLYPDVYTGTKLLKMFHDYHDVSAISVGALYSTEWLNNNALLFYEGVFHEDIIFFIKTILSAKRAGCSTKAIYHYFRRENAITTALANNQHLRSWIIVYWELCSFVSCLNLAKELWPAITEYLLWAYKQIEEFYLISFDFNNLIFEDIGHQIVFQNIRRRFDGLNIKSVSKDEFDIIISSDKILVYGAGKIGMEVVNYLIRHAIHRFFIVLSDDQPSSFLAGNKTHSISEFLTCRDECVVLVAVGNNLKSNIKSNLERLGFTKIIYMT